MPQFCSAIFVLSEVLFFQHNVTLPIDYKDLNREYQSASSDAQRRVDRRFGLRHNGACIAAVDTHVIVCSTGHIRHRWLRELSTVHARSLGLWLRGHA